MRYENETVVFPMGMKFRAGTEDMHHTINNCKFLMRNRRDTLKMGNATRIRKLTEDTTFENCVIYMEGTLVMDRVIPLAVHGCFIYGTSADELPVKIGGAHDYVVQRKGGNKYA
jgi:hypothetical protein